MKLATRKSVSISEQRRNRLQSDRARAQALRDSFPHVGTVRIELRFDDRSENAPSPQLHTLYPSARAFFRFACPCAECDGDFDLAPAVTALLNEAGRSRRPADRTARGQLQCQGIRSRDRASSRPCPIELSYQLTAGPEAAD
jgi:hypothetical protein